MQRSRAPSTSARRGSRANMYAYEITGENNTFAAKRSKQTRGGGGNNKKSYRQCGVSSLMMDSQVLSSTCIGTEELQKLSGMEVRDLYASCYPDTDVYQADAGKKDANGMPIRRKHKNLPVQTSIDSFTPEMLNNLEKSLSKLREAVQKRNQLTFLPKADRTDGKGEAFNNSSVYKKDGVSYVISSKRNPLSYIAQQQQEAVAQKGEEEEVAVTAQARVDSNSLSQKTRLAQNKVISRMTCTQLGKDKPYDNDSDVEEEMQNGKKIMSYQKYHMPVMRVLPEDHAHYIAPHPRGLLEDLQSGALASMFHEDEHVYLSSISRGLVLEIEKLPRYHTLQEILRSPSEQSRSLFAGKRVTLCYVLDTILTNEFSLANAFLCSDTQTLVLVVRLDVDHIFYAALVFKLTPEITDNFFSQRSGNKQQSVLTRLCQSPDILNSAAPFVSSKAKNSDATPVVSNLAMGIHRASAMQMAMKESNLSQDIRSSVQYLNNCAAWQHEESVAAAIGNVWVIRDAQLEHFDLNGLVTLDQQQTIHREVLQHPRWRQVDFQTDASMMHSRALEEMLSEPMQHSLTVREWWYHMRTRTDLPPIMFLSSRFFYCGCASERTHPYVAVVAAATAAAATDDDNDKVSGTRKTPQVASNKKGEEKKKKKAGGSSSVLGDLIETFGMEAAVAKDSKQEVAVNMEVKGLPLVSPIDTNMSGGPNTFNFKLESIRMSDASRRVYY